MRPRNGLVTCVLVSACLAAPPPPSAHAATVRGITLASPGTTAAVTFDAVAGDAVFFSTTQPLDASTRSVAELASMAVQASEALAGPSRSSASTATRWNG